MCKLHVEGRNAFQILIGKHKGRHYFGDIGEDGSMTFIQI